MPLLGTGEREQVLHGWNSPARAVDGAACIHSLFEAQAARTPEAVAVLHEERSLTYRELDARANQLARHLREHGVGPEDRVGVCLERSPELVVALLGVLKAGAAYVPLDPVLSPRAPALACCEDSRSQVLITQSKLPSADLGGSTLIHLDRDWVEISSAARWRSRAQPRALRAWPTCSTPRAPPACPRAS